MEVQRQPGLRHRDGVRRVPARPDVEPAELEAAVRRTSLWARRSREAEPAPRAAGVRDRPGRHRPGAARAKRRRHPRHRVRRLRDRRAVGGRGARRDAAHRLRHHGHAARRPAALLHGHRRPGGRARGDRRAAWTCSTACCPPGSAAPARRSSPAGGSTCATPGSPATSAPLVEGCTCPACTTFSRAYIRHLITQDEIVGLRLLTLHNLHTVIDLVASARASRSLQEASHVPRI